MCVYLGIKLICCKPLASVLKQPAPLLSTMIHSSKIRKSSQEFCHAATPPRPPTPLSPWTLVSHSDGQFPKFFHQVHFFLSKTEKIVSQNHWVTNVKESVTAGNSFHNDVTIKSTLGMDLCSVYSCSHRKGNSYWVFLY